jgi:thiol:disulfide interchange protein
VSRAAAVTRGTAGVLAAIPVMLARVSLPALAIVALAVLIVVAAGCWVLADSGRARRLAALIRAWRRTTATPAAPARPALARPQRQATRKNW